ncbi:hypothetical protein BD311DRAFT_744103 [Dichomitus squalens]|uniref:Uncharacterized protein n=1 Tax=Dichomitus squalens TaxID=114155 RepID=A0A4Q9N8C1_9APHY|nr:hypothetical protein BD311DRAFT_744103 [Dichomitus squalens]
MLWTRGIQAVWHLYVCRGIVGRSCRLYGTWNSQTDSSYLPQRVKLDRQMCGSRETRSFSLTVGLIVCPFDLFAIIPSQVVIRAAASRGRLRRLTNVQKWLHCRTLSPCPIGT